MLTDRFRQSWLWPFILLSIPPVIWLFIALSNGYVLEGDNAQIAIRTHDVFSKNPPLLGMPSTAGNEVGGTELFHPGPLHFILLAPLYWLSGFETWGLLVGALAVNLSLVAVGLSSVWRLGSPYIKTSAVTVFAVLVVFLQGALFTPWNPYPLIIGTVSALFLVWALLVGRSGSWALLAVVGSLVVQSHLVGLVLVFTITATVFVTPSSFPFVNRPRSPEMLRASLLLAVCWILPVWETLSNWPGNLGQLWKYLSGLGGGRNDAGIIEPMVLALLTAFVLGGASFFAFRRAISDLRRLDDFTEPSDLQVTATGILLCATVTGVSAVAYVIFDSSRWYYLWFLSGVWLLTVLLLARIRSSWWSKPSKLTIVLVAGLALLCIDSVKKGTERVQNGKQSQAVLEAARSLLGEHQNRPIVVEQHGQAVWSGPGMAVIVDQLTQGRDVYYNHFGGRLDYDPQRRPNRAPDQHLVLHLVQRDPDGNWPSISSVKSVGQRDVRLDYFKTDVRLILAESQ